MAATWDQTWDDEIKQAIKLLEDRRSDISGSYLTQEAVVLGTNRLDAYNTAGKAAGVSRFRARLDNVLRGGADLIDPSMVELGRIMGSDLRDPGLLLRELTDYMVDNSYRITSRQFSRGSWTAGGSNVGTGTINRLCVDENGLPLEASFADTITVECTEDRQTATDPGRELLTFTGLPNPDYVTWYQSGYGSGLRSTIRSFSADDTTALLLNPSFSDYSGTVTTLTELTNWEVTSGTIGTDFEIVTADYYRGAVLEGSTPSCLKCEASVAIRQKLSTRQAKLDSRVPYYFQIAWKANGNGQFTGTLDVAIGSKTYSVTIAAQEGWQILKVDLDKYCYLKNFNTDDLGVTITVTKTSAASTYLLLDDIVWRTWAPYDGTWYAPVGGATPWRLEDTGTFTDTEGASNSKLQRWWHRIYNWSLPSAPAKPSSGLSAAEGAAGNVDGVVQYKVTFLDNYDNESGGNTTATSITVSSKQVSLSSIPTGGTGIAKRRVYRTTGGGSTFKLLTTISDNSTTVYTDNIADGSLGATIPTGVTISDPS